MTDRYFGRIIALGGTLLLSLIIAIATLNPALAAQQPASPAQRGTTFLLNEGFDAVGTPFLPSGWTVANPNNDATWISVNDESHAGNQSASIDWPGDTVSKDDWLFSPAVNLAVGGVYRLTFHYRGQATNFPEKLSVFYGTSPAVSDQTNPLVDLPNIKTSTFQMATQLFTPTVSGSYHIGFHSYSTPAGDVIWVDTVQLSVEVAPPTCFATPDNGATVYDSADASAVQQAIDAASLGATVKVAGTCESSSTQAGDQIAYLTNPLTLEGGYSQDNWDAAPDSTQFPTILDANDQHRVVEIDSDDNSPSAITLSYLTIRGGKVGSLELGRAQQVPGLDGQSPDGQKTIGSMQVPGESMCGRNSATVREDEGGGILVCNGNVTIRNSTLSGNLASEGGGISVYGSVVLANSSLIANIANSGGGISAGGVFADGNVTIVDSTLSNNQAIFHGGAINNVATTMIIRRSMIENNKAEDDGDFLGQGGGIYNRTDASIENSTISDNQADMGAGVYSRIVSPTVGSLRMTHVTLFRNVPGSGNGGSLHNDDGLVIVQNSILAFSVTSGAFDCVDAGTGGNNIALDHTLVQDGSCGANLGNGGNQTGSPNLAGVPAFNGGPTKTYAFDGASSAINAANNANCLATDQRGYGRSGDCDMGAYEAEGAPTVVTLNNLSTKMPHSYPILIATALSLMSITSLRYRRWFRDAP